MILVQISTLSKSILMSLFIYWFIPVECECEKDITIIHPTYTVTETEGKALDQYTYETRLDWDSYSQSWFMRKYPVKVKDGGYVVKRTMREVDQIGYILICPNIWDDIFND